MNLTRPVMYTGFGLTNLSHLNLCRTKTSSSSFTYLSSLPRLCVLDLSDTYIDPLEIHGRQFERMAELGWMKLRSTSRMAISIHEAVSENGGFDYRGIPIDMIPLLDKFSDFNQTRDHDLETWLSSPIGRYRRLEYLIN